MKKFGFLKKNNLATLLSLATVILVCVFSSQTIDPVLVPRYIFTTALTLLFVLLIFSQKKYNWTSSISFLKDSAALPFYIFITASTLAIINASALSEALFTLSNYILFFVFLLVALAIIQGKSANINTIIKGISLAGLVIFGFGLYQLYVLSPRFPVPMEELYSLKSTFGHKNLFASASLLTLFFAVYGAFQLSAFWRFLSALSAIASLATIILLQTRSAILALIVAVAALIFIAVVSRFLSKLVSHFSEKILWIFSGMLVIVFSVVYFLPQNPVSELHVSESIQDQDDRSFTIKERSLLWEGSLNMAMNESYLGVGPGNWKIRFPLYGSGIWRARQGMVQFQRPHNDFLWMLTESGIVGLASYFLLFGIVLLRGFKLQLQKISTQEKWLIRFTMAAIIAYMVVAFFSFPRERIFHQWMLTLSFAFIFSLSLKHSSPSTKKWPITIAMLVLLLPMLWIGAERLQGEKISTRILQHREAGNWNDLLDDVTEVKKLHFYEMDPVSMPVDFYAGLAHLSLKNYDEALRYTNKAYAIHPFNIHVINNLAGIHQLKEEFTEAIKFYALAIQIAPYYKDGILNLSAAYFNNNQALEAYNVLLKWHDKFEPNEEAYNYYLIFELRTILLNLADSENHAHLFQNPREFNDDWLLNCHHAAIETGRGIEEIMLERLSTIDN